MSGSVLVIGGANMDIIGFTAGALVPRDSNPGHVRRGHGGVGRNIAENLARLGVDVELVTALGDDDAGVRMLEECGLLGIGTRAALVVDDLPTSTYLAVMDEHHDLSVAVNDMRALQRLDETYVRGLRDRLTPPRLLVLDANLERAALEAAVALWPDVPVLLDPVSTVKAVRAERILDGLTVLKANEMEAAVLAGLSADTAPGLDKIADRLMDAGVGRLFISRGPAGVYCAEKNERLHVAAPHVDVANTTGAGDAFAAGVAYATLEGLALRDAAEFATAVAGATLVTERTVSEDLSVAGLDRHTERRKT